MKDSYAQSGTCTNSRLFFLNPDLVFPVFPILAFLLDILSHTKFLEVLAYQPWKAMLKQP